MSWIARWKCHDTDRLLALEIFLQYHLYAVVFAHGSCRIYWNRTRDDVYNWLLENSYKYGFIQRYPSGKTSITGVANEPWHYRYVGKKAAEEIHQSGMCLEEYVENLK